MTECGVKWARVRMGWIWGILSSSMVLVLASLVLIHSHVAWSESFAIAAENAAESFQCSMFNTST